MSLGGLKPSGNVGIVLTGGDSRRMGANKALLRHGEKPFAQLAAELLQRECKSVYLVGGMPTELKPLGWPHMTDTSPGSGPLGGIATAFERTSADNLVVLPCDLPLISQDIIQGVIARARQGWDVTVVLAGQTLHPLVGVYSRRILPNLQRCLSEGDKSVKGLLSLCRKDGMTIGYYAVDENAMPMMNVNTPLDFKNLPRFASQHHRR